MLADYKHELHTAPLSSPPGREWMFRLADALENVLDGLGDTATGAGVAQPGGGWISGPSR
jgi:hypothetical protein